MTPYEYCAFCGKGGANRGQRPHNDDPCPLLVAEHEACLSAIRDPQRGLAWSPRGDRSAEHVEPVAYTYTGFAGDPKLRRRVVLDDFPEEVPPFEAVFPELLPGWATVEGEHRLSYGWIRPGELIVAGVAVLVTANVSTDPVFVLEEAYRPVVTLYDPHGRWRAETDGRFFFFGAGRVL